jgi:hypothetical protein
MTEDDHQSSSQVHAYMYIFEQIRETTKETICERTIDHTERRKAKEKSNFVRRYQRGAMITMQVSRQFLSLVGCSSLLQSPNNEGSIPYTRWRPYEQAPPPLTTVQLLVAETADSAASSSSSTSGSVGWSGPSWCRHRCHPDYAAVAVRGKQPCRAVSSNKIEETNPPFFLFISRIR